MYKKILIPLENTPTDKFILEHITGLIKLTGASVVLIHVADGFAARLQNELDLEDSEEIIKDRKYLEQCQKNLTNKGFSVTSHLINGDPSSQILAIAEKENCDLIAMSTHGHRFVKDIILGSVADNIRHRAKIPILMVRAT